MPHAHSEQDSAKTQSPQPTAADAPKADDAQDSTGATAPTSPGFFAIVLSTLAAAIGVQSRRNQARDFSQGKVIHYVVAGVIFTALFVLSLVFLVRMVLSQ